MTDDSLETVRRRLRELGYLKDPVSGWLVSARGGGSRIRIVLGLSARTGLIGGALLAIPAAVAIIAGAPGAVATFPEFLLLLGWLILFLGSVLAITEIAAELILSAIAHRGMVLVGRMERLAGRVGLLFTIATTLYLAALLRGGRIRAHPDERGLTAWLLWIAALLAALGAGHVIGRLTRLGSLVTLMMDGESSPPHESTSGRPGTRRAGRGILLTASLLLAVAVPIVFLLPGRGVRQASVFEPVGRPGKVVLVGVDGLSPDALDAIDDHHPALSRIAARSAWYDVRREPGIPPSVWTTIATGRSPSDHGVTAYSGYRLPGLAAPVQTPVTGPSFSPGMLLPPVFRAPVSSNVRRAPAVWEILAGAGREGGVVNWWATWPAVSEGGIVVSERAYVRFLAGTEPDRDVSPPDLQRALASRFTADHEEAARRLESLRAAIDGGRSGRDLLSHQAGMTDGYHGLVAARLLRERALRLLMLYLPGLDILGVRGEPGPARDVLIGQIDGILTDLEASMGPMDLMMLVADPGRSESDSPGRLLIWGERVSVPGRRGDVRSEQIAPTVLALSGFPVAEDMPGAPLLDFLPPGDPAAAGVASIATYGDRSPENGGTLPDDSLDDEVLDRLRSLGYIR